VHLVLFCGGAQVNNNFVAYTIGITGAGGCIAKFGKCITSGKIGITYAQLGAGAAACGAYYQR
jgi:hypothetical protein